MKKLSILALPLVLLFSSCKNARSEGPYGFKLGQEYEYKVPIFHTDRDGKRTYTGEYKTFSHIVFEVGPDWVEFEQLDSGETIRLSKQQLSKRLPRYSLIGDINHPR